MTRREPGVLLGFHFVWLNKLSCLHLFVQGIGGRGTFIVLVLESAFKCASRVIRTLPDDRGAPFTRPGAPGYSLGFHNSYSA